MRLFHDAEPCATSQIAEFVAKLPIKSKTAICHIRQANVGNINLSNTHPFTRELWGRCWVFAHNGQIPGFTRRTGMYEAIGDTDSEELFCDLMNHVRQNLQRDATAEQLATTLVALSKSYAEQGVFNCLLSNGCLLYTSDAADE